MKNDYMPAKYIFCFLPLIALSFFSFQSQQQQGEYRTEEYYSAVCNCLVRATYFPTGKIFSYQELDSATWEPAGADILFFENGDTASYGYYKNGMQQGLYYNKYKNGKIRIVTDYHNGRIQESRFYSEEGKLLEATKGHKWDRTGNLSMYEIDYYNDGEVLTYTEQFENRKKATVKVHNQKLYNDMMYAKENRTGEQLFKDNCTSCHDPLTDATGPNLRGVTLRHSETWLRKWISGPSVLLANGDKEAWEVYNKWNRTAMTAFLLKKKDMDKLIDYLKTLK